MLTGNVELIVPPEAEIRMESVRCVFGEVKQQGKRPPRVRSIVRRLVTGERGEERSGGDQDEPLLLVVTGRAILGNIHATVRQGGPVDFSATQRGESLICNAEAVPADSYAVCPPRVGGARRAG
ncbi:MAG: hypothetical protein JRH01_00010 [Deltaproteobacteria bacterium]|nr:hypothetical protein [Deltaproteobacteria bacterium]MBW2392782.1 hypothetical protein [Deltaproteobacteria bacterium]